MKLSIFDVWIIEIDWRAIAALSLAGTIVEFGSLQVGVSVKEARLRRSTIES